MIIKVDNISKYFGPTRALHDVFLQVKEGEVRGLIGENGSGKSTICSIIAGIQKADEGSMSYDGKPYLPVDILDAKQLGVCMIVQEQSTIDTITVAENIFLGKEDNFINHGLVDKKEMEREAQTVLEYIGVMDIKSNTLLKNLDFEDKKLVEIARAFSMNPKLLIVDETTTALSRNGRELLYSMMKKLCSEGGSVIFISHDIEEIMEKSDSITVLRDGKLSANLSKKDFSETAIRNLMVGREISSEYYRVDFDGALTKDVVIKAENITAKTVRNISLELHKGEILGIGGLTECGMHELGALLFGIGKPESGRILFGDGGQVKNPNHSIKRKVGYISKNRDIEALLTASSVKDNICISSYPLISSFGMITNKSEVEFSEKWAKEMDVKMASVESAVSSLSGGNKQKVAIAKWLANKTDIFIMDCPTRGIDVGVKASIYRLMERLKKDGKSIIMISEELPELLGMSDRIIILKDGSISGEYRRDIDLSENILIEAMI